MEHFESPATHELAAWGVQQGKGQRMLKNLGTIAVLAGLLAHCPALFPGQKPGTTGSDFPAKIKQLRPVVVEVLVNGRRTGTGFFVSPAGYGVTAMHLVGQILAQASRAVPVHFERIEVVSRDGRSLPAEPVVNPDTEAAASYDIALLKVALQTPALLKVASYKEVVEGEEVYFMGFPFDAPGAVTYRGTVSAKFPMRSIEILPLHKSLASESIQIQAPVARGFSRSPLLTFKGDTVVGVVTSKLGGITPKLDEIRNGIQSSQATGSQVKFLGVDAPSSIKELIDVLDSFLSAGAGAAVSIDYIAGATKQTDLEISRGHSKSTK